MSSVTTATRRPAAVITWLALAVLMLLAAAFATMYFQSSRDLEAHKLTIATLQTELLATKTEFAKEAARAAELKSDLHAARSDVQAANMKTAHLTSEIDTKEQALTQAKAKADSAQAALLAEKSKAPTVPVRIQMRRSAMGRGLVAVLTNHSDRQLPLLVAMRNPTTGSVKQMSTQVAPGARLEIGFQEGWQFASADQMRVRSAGFEDLAYTVP